MRFGRGFGLLIMFLLLTAGTVTAAQSAVPVAVAFNGQRTPSDVRAIESGGQRYVNLPFLEKYLYAVTNWDPAKGELLVRFGRFTLQLQEDKAEYYQDKERKTLKVAPFEQGSQLWIPVEFLINLGMAVKSEGAGRIDLGWAGNYLLDMENITYEGRPAFILIGTDPLDFTPHLLANPGRMFLDLTGIKIHPAFDDKVKQNQIVTKVRFFQSDPEKLRFVFDLSKLTGYKILRNPEKPNQLTIVFNYFVEEILFPKDGGRKIAVKTSFPGKYVMTELANPRRLVIDFDGASLGEKALAINGDDQWIKGVRISQFNPATVRVVLDLLDNVPCFIYANKDNLRQIEIRPSQNITQLVWEKTDSGDQLVIEAESGLFETIRKLRQPERLQIDLSYARFAADLKPPTVAESAQVKSVKLSSPNSNTARIDIELASYTGYTARFSPDRHRLTINFRRSPLTGRTIILDAGHGGLDTGAAGRQGTQEKDINFEVTMRLKDLLEEAGARVVLTRTNDSFLSLYERAFIANNTTADLFISIHTNSHNDYNVQGIEVYNFPEHIEAKQLAATVNSALMEATGLISLGVKTNDFVVIRETQMPGILVELGYLSNYQEETTIRTPEFRIKAAQGIFKGIVGYYQSL